MKYSHLFFTGVVLFAWTVCAATLTDTWDPIIVGTQEPSAAANTALADWKTLGVDFQASAPEKGFDSDEQTREPAAVQKKKTPVAPAYHAQKSRLPASVTDGFEMRVQIGSQVSTFWVVKRGDHHDLLFANNSGSRVSVGLSTENFSYLQSAARDLPVVKDDVKRCPASLVQVQVVEKGRAVHSVSTCANTKGKSADRVRMLGGLLSNMIR